MQRQEKSYEPFATLTVSAVSDEMFEVDFR